MRAFATPERRASLAALDQTRGRDTAGANSTPRLPRTSSKVSPTTSWPRGTRASLTTPKGQQLVLYADALMWRAMTYTKPMGVCGGVTNYWSDPPA